MGYCKFYSFPGFLFDIFVCLHYLYVREFLLLYGNISLYQLIHCTCNSYVAVLIVANSRLLQC